MSESPDGLTVPHNHPTSSECEREKSGTIIFKLETERDLERKRIQDSQESVRRLQDFLQEDEEDMDQYLLSSKTLLRYALLMDVVQPSSRRSVCFTKGCVPYDIPMYYDKYFIYFTYMFYKKKKKSFIFKFYNYLYMPFFFFTWCFFLICFQPPIGVYYLTRFTILKMISSANIFAGYNRWLFVCSYGHYVEGTGSVLQSCVDVELERVFKNLELLSEEDRLKQLLQLKLRYFTPREIANIMGFPADFSKT